MSENTELNTAKATVEELSVKGVEKSTKVQNSSAAVEDPVENTPKKEVSLPTYELSTFNLTRILQNNTLRKTIALLGTFPDVSATDVAVVLLEKQAFKERDVQTAREQIADEAPRIFSNALQVQTEFINNIYGSFQCVPNAELNAIKTTVVYPATEKHIEKYSITQKYLITETPELYEQLTLPYITSTHFSLDWVYNILEHRQETERIVYEDSDPETGFVLLPDLKWDGKTLETLYLLAIVHKHDIKSLRDLNSTHLPLLYNLRDGIARNINPVRGDAPGIWCEKSHMLDTVISNIELMPDYYQRVTLPFVLFEGSKLLDEYDERKAVRKHIKKNNVLADEMEKIKLPESGAETEEPPVKKTKLAANVEQPPELLKAAAE